MIDRIISFSIQNKLIIGLLTLLLVIWGSYSVTQLPIDAVPDITNNQVQVISTAPTLAAQEVERFITSPIEFSVATIPDMIELRSTSRFGLSVVTIVFKDEVDIYKARQMVSERLKEAEAQIPKGMGKPELAPVTTGLGEIYQYVLHTKRGSENKFTAMDLRTIQDWIVRRQLLGTPGVAEVSSFGGYLKQYEIAVNPEKLRSMNLTLEEVFEALEKNNENTGGAYIDKKPNAYFIRGIGLVSGIEDIQKIVVKMTPQGLPVLLRDVAAVQYGHAVRYGAMTRNADGEVVGGLVLMLKGANSAEVIGEVKKRIKNIEKTLPEGIVIEPFLDRTKLVNNAISTVTTNLAEGALIVVFVLVLLLGNIRAGLVVASVIPLSMLFAVSMMNAFGVSGNLMSLGAIDFGLIVDGAVIIVENVLHRITRSQHHVEGGTILSREQMDDEVQRASSVLMRSAAFGQIIILIVYLPILSLVGIEGKMFKPMAQTVSFAILGALILSLTYIPMMSALALSRKTMHTANISAHIMRFLHKRYDPTIRFALRRKALVIGSSAILLFFTFVAFLNMGGEFIPTLEEGDFAVETRLMAGASLSQTVETMTKASDVVLKNFPEVKEVVGKIGTSEIPTDPMPIEAADMMIILKDREEWVSASSRDELAEKMAGALSIFPGVEFGFQQPIQMRFNELMTGARQDVVIKLFGEDIDVLSDYANRVAKAIQNVPGVADLFVEKVTGLPQIQVKYKRDKIAQYGLNIADVNRVLRTAFAGETAGQVFEGERRFDMVVRLDKAYRSELEDVKQLYISLPNGHQIPIQEVAEILFEKGPMQISREDAKRRIYVGLNVRNRDVESLVEEISYVIESKIKLPSGYYITYGGAFENLIAAKSRLAIAVPASLLLILILLFFTFHSIKETLLIFSAIPLAAIGGVFALLIRSMPFSISAGVGFIALFGVAVLNGIVLIGYFNQLEKEGVEDIQDRILKGTKGRLRPVIMTAAVASLGFLPMALSSSSGAEVQKPLATVVIGGLISSTLLTLIVLPVLYAIFFKLRSASSRSGITPVVGILFVFVLITSSSVLAQSPATKISLDDAIKTAVENNLGIKAAEGNVDYQKALRKTAWDLGKTELGYTRGQFNSGVTDRSYSITQTIQFPTNYLLKQSYSSRLVKLSETDRSIRRKELIRNVRLVYYALLVNHRRQVLLAKQDSIYGRFEQAAKVKFDVGESASLELLTAQTQLQAIKIEKNRIEADGKILLTSLSFLMNSNAMVGVDETTPIQMSASLDSVAQSPVIDYYLQNVSLAQTQLSLERSQFLPDIRMGFTNTSIDNKKGFRFYEIGLSVSLWFWPQAGRVQAAGIAKKNAQLTYQFQKQGIETEYSRLSQELKKNEATVSYYKEFALKQADQIIDQTQKSYLAGNITYVEFVQNTTLALRIKQDYLDRLTEYNETAILLNYIAGK